jgi:RNA-directed DNA polymerase
LIPQALLHVLQPAWDPPFSDHSDGFRPRRSAHQALARAQQYLEEGYDWGVDLDLEKVFDRVNHDKLMSLVKGRVAERRVLHLIDRDLKAGALTGDGFEATVEGTPQGVRCRPCSRTCCWMTSTRNWRGAATASSATPTTGTSTSGVAVRASA